jgi:3-oxoacyl-[acyl-carrier-protein] synthase-3
MLSVKIAGMGTYLPPYRVLNADLEKELALPTGWIERTTGVLERRRVQQETTAGMAALASRLAIEQAGIEGESIDLILGASAGPQQGIPCTASFVQQELGLPEGRSCCFDVNGTCMSFLLALDVAARFLITGAYRRVLIFSSENARHGLNPREPESAALIGDAAAAAIVTSSAIGEQSQIWHTRFETWSSGAHLSELLGAGTLHPANDPTTTFEMNTFHMDGPALFKKSVRLFGPFLERFLAEVGWQRSMVAAVVPHQSSGRGVAQLSERFGFRPEQVIVNLPTRGNCIAASIPLALAEAVQLGRIRRGDRVLLLGSAAGLMFGAVAMTW